MTQSFVLDESVDSAAESDEEDEVPAITFSSEFSRRYSHLPQRLKVRALCRADFESAFLQIRSTAQRQAKHHTDGIPAQWS